jgi:hypothetical protein
MKDFLMLRRRELMAAFEIRLYDKRENTTKERPRQSDSGGKAAQYRDVARRVGSMRSSNTSHIPNVRRAGQHALGE